MKRWLILLSAISLFLVGCDTTTKQVLTVDSLQHSWVLTKIDGKDLAISEPRIMTGMAIDADLNVAGFGGCNRFTGRAEIADGNKFRITSMGSTKMACIQAEQATVESIMTTSLQEWNNASLENNVLTLTSEQHVLTFQPEEILDEGDPL
ncbi:META domain-containing protein [Photobacterium nomapromontoriensis]|uniref:META domain-containing protein n=1 Tax=Photobacterium nomapromontoriensis TaxID=2910237 RepID=UPI003D12EC93